MLQAAKRYILWHSGRVSITVRAPRVRFFDQWEDPKLWKRVVVATLLALAFGPYPLIASAAGYSLSGTGTRQSTNSSTTCGASFGDAYDTFCPSDPIITATCECDSYNASVSDANLRTSHLRRFERISIQSRPSSDRILWTDDEGGRKCRGRPLILPIDAVLKTVLRAALLRCADYHFIRFCSPSMRTTSSLRGI